MSVAIASQSPSKPVAVIRVVTRGPSLLTTRALLNAVFISIVVALVLSVAILVGLDGLGYYTTPLKVRGYHPMHGLLRPSGPVGQTLGVAGALMMLVPFGYMLRKRVFRRAGPGNLKVWLEVHIFCGIVGPVAITFHTAFKFNGLVSVAYWSMVAVALSGFVGRYLYVRIPRTIRGIEVDAAELEQRAADLREQLESTVRPDLMNRLDALEQAIVEGSDRFSWGLAHGDGARLRQRLQRLGEEFAREGGDRGAIHAVLTACAERAALRRRLKHLDRIKRLFELWHVFHLPLVYVMFGVVALHVAVVLYLGYVPFRW